MANQDELVIQLENTGTGRTISIGKDDIIIPIKKRLGDYVRDITAKNYYPLKGGTESFLLHNPDGTPTTITAQDSGNAVKTFVDTFPSANLGPQELQKISNSGYLDTNSGPFLIKKGRSNANIPSGNDILQDINQNGEASSFVVRTREVLKENNLSYIGNQFVPSGTGTDDGNVGIALVQKEKGVHYPRKKLGSATSAGLAAEVPALLTIKELKKLGALTMIRASGEVYAPSDPNAIQQDFAARGATLVPGLARIGQKIPVSRFSVKNIMADIDPNFRRPELPGFDTKEIYSYGNVNNYLVPFAGLSSTSSIIAAQILALVITTMLKTLSLVVVTKKRASDLLHPGNSVGGLISGNVNEGTVGKKRKKKLGSFLGKDKPSLIDIHTTDTYNDYFQCVDRGISVFFGMDSNTLSAGVVVGGLTNIAKNHGFYNVILRNLIRSATDDFINSFGLSLGNVAPQIQFGTANKGFAPEQDGIGGLLDPIAMITKLNNSTLLKFINVIASLGDKVILLEKQGYDTDSLVGSGLEISEISDIDKIVGIKNEQIEVSNIHSKDRLSDRINALAWNSHSTPSIYWFPKELLAGSNTYFGTTDNAIFKGMAGVADKTVVSSSLGNRINKEEVEAIEQRLDAEYMPFYFHDLRTNEIISFHAFLEDLTDSFSPDYESTEGYGRIGEVLTYKNTKRSISLSFKVASTSPEDFDQMWWKINKLITLVYPQYTEGRRLKDGDKQFIQPFSQLPSASPMIRIRLGDLLKTNYTKFGLARLFGVSSPYFQMNTNTSTFNLNTEHYQSSLDDVKKRMAGLGNINEDRWAPGQHAVLRANGQPGVGGITNSYPVDSVGPLTNNSAFNGLITYEPLVVKIANKITGTTYKVDIVTSIAGREGHQFIVQDSDLSPTPEGVSRARRVKDGEPLNNSNSVPLADVTNFFSSDPSTSGGGNAIFRSFETTSGKGLAGFIKSLNFDYNQTTWETGRDNSRAPKFMKVSIEFAPIHDLNPGIDSDGFSTATVYNVGSTIGALNGQSNKGNL